MATEQVLLVVVEASLLNPLYHLLLLLLRVGEEAVLLEVMLCECLLPHRLIRLCEGPSLVILLLGTLVEALRRQHRHPGVVLMLLMS